MLRSRAVKIRTFMMCAVIAASSTTIVACGGGDDSLGPDDAVAITIGEVKVTNGEIEHRARALAKQQAESSGAEPPTAGSDEFTGLRRTAAENLRDEAVFGILAKRCGKPCTVTKADVNQQIAQAITQQFGGSRPAFDKRLEELGITMKDLQAQFLAGLQEQKLSDRQVRNITFTEAQARAYYNRNIATYRTPAEKRVAHILVGTRPVATKLRAELTPANFAQIARARSIDPAAKSTGGDLGPTTAGGLLPEIQEAMRKLKPGQISQPVETQFGWSIVTVRDVPATTRAFATVKDEIMAEQLQVAQNTALERWRATVVKKVQDGATYGNDKIKPESVGQSTMPTETGAGETTTATATTTAEETTTVSTTTSPTATAPPSTTTAAEPATTTTAPTATTPAP